MVTAIAMLERGSGNCSVFRPSYGPLAIDFTASAVADDVRALRAWSEIPASPFLPSFPPSARGASSTFKVPEMTEGRRLVRRVSSPPRRFWAPQKCASKERRHPIYCLGRYKSAKCTVRGGDRSARATRDIWPNSSGSIVSIALSMVRNNRRKDDGDAALFFPFPPPFDSSQFHDIEEFHLMGMASEGMD